MGAAGSRGERTASRNLRLISFSANPLLVVFQKARSAALESGDVDSTFFWSGSLINWIGKECCARERDRAPVLHIVTINIELDVTLAAHCRCGDQDRTSFPSGLPAFLVFGDLPKVVVV
jgi:hypothetical protein